LLSTAQSGKKIMKCCKFCIEKKVKNKKNFPTTANTRKLAPLFIVWCIFPFRNSEPFLGDVMFPTGQLHTGRRKSFQILFVASLLTASGHGVNVYAEHLSTIIICG